MTKEQKEYKKLVSYILKDVKKSLKPMIKKIVQEEVIFAAKLLNEINSQQTSVTIPSKTTDSEISRTIKNKSGNLRNKYVQLLEDANINVPVSETKTLKFMGQEIPIEMTQEENIQSELGDVTLQGHESVAQTKEVAELAVRIQTKDYSKLMKKMLTSNKNKMGQA